jgi:Domain of unknown function (DUF4395)
VTPIDSRGLRVGQAVVAVALLAGFVFSTPLIIPVAMIVVGIGVATGPVNDPLARLAASIIDRGPARRRAPADRPARLIDPLAQRITAAGEAATLAVASACLLVDVDGLAWIFGLVVAVVAATMAVTNVSLGYEVYERFNTRKP